MLRHGSEEQKQNYLPGIASGDIRFQAFGVTEPTSGSDTLQLKTRAVRNGDDYVVNGQKIWTSRAHKSDLMMLLVRTTPLDEIKKRSDGLSVLLVDMNDALDNGLTLRRIDAMINHQTNEVFIDNLRVPAENLIGERGQGVSLHFGRHECRANFDIGGKRRRLPVLYPPGLGICVGARRLRQSDRQEPGHPIPDRPCLRRMEGRRFGEPGRSSAVRRGTAVRRRSQHRQVFDSGSGVERRRSLHANLRRLCRRPANTISSANGGKRACNGLRRFPPI